MAIFQYGQVMKGITVGESTIDQETGAIITTPDVEFTVPCRYLPNTSAKLVRTVDGQSVVYRGTCYVHKGLALQLNNGDLVSVDGFINQPVAILQIHRAQFRTRIIL